MPKVRKQDSGYARAGDGRDVVDGEKVAANGQEVAVLYRALLSAFSERGKRGEGRGERERGRLGGEVRDDDDDEMSTIVHDEVRRHQPFSV